MTEDRRIEGPGKQLRIFIGESDRWHNRSLADALLEMLRAEGLAGATVLRGVAGFGAHSRIHTAHVLRLSEDLPIVIEAVDTAEQISKVLPKLNEMVGEGLVTLSDVEIVKYSHRDSGHRPVEP
jgi:PII-like signaling protein